MWLLASRRVSLPLFTAYLLGSFLFVHLTDSAQLRSKSPNNARTSIDIAIHPKKYTPDQLLILSNHFRNQVGKKENEHLLERLPHRRLAEGDWDFLNTFFGSLDLSAQIDQTFSFGMIEFTVGEAICDGFKIRDIITESSGSNTQHDISFLVTGITISCQLNYSYKGGWAIGRGNGDLEIEISPSSSIETILSFFSDDFSTDPPSTSKLTCLPNLQIEDISFSSFLLNLFVAPFLPNTIQPYLEPTICEPLGIVETMLSDSVLNISDILDDLADPIPPKLNDKLAPEMRVFNNYSKPINVEFVPMQPLVDVSVPVIEALVHFVSNTISHDDGPIRIPLNVTLDEEMEIALNEIRVLGLKNFTFDPLSLIGNYTLSTTYEIDYIGIEADIGISNPDGSTDVIVMKTGVHNVVSDFALLLVIEQSIFNSLEAVFPIVDVIKSMNITDIDFDAIKSTVTNVAIEIFAGLNVTDIITDFANVTDITQIMDIISKTFSKLDLNEIIAKIDFTVFEGLIPIVGEMIKEMQDFDIVGVLNRVVNSIYAIEIASFSVRSSKFDAVDINGLTQFIGLQNMFNRVSEAVFSMYDASLINVVDFFLQSKTRGFLNNLLMDSFVYDSCLEKFSGSTVYVPSDAACMKMELFEGGDLSADYSDATCSKDVHNGEYISSFSYSTKNAAYFEGSWSSEAVFVEDFTVPELQVVSSMDNETKVLFMALTYPSCSKSF